MTVGVDIDSSEFEKNGYAVIPEIFTKDEAAEAWAAFDRFEVPDDRRSCNERIVLREAIFHRLLTNDRLLDAVQSVLGADLQLIAMDSLETRPNRGPGGEGSQTGWHVDFSAFVPATVCVNVGIYLQDMTPEFGPLRVVPGSHRWGRRPEGDECSAERADQVEVPVNAGTGVMFDAQIWHTGSANRTDRPRRGMFTYFGHYWMKRMDEFARSPLPEFITTSSDPRLRQLFGLGLVPPSPHGADYNPTNPRWW